MGNLKRALAPGIVAGLVVAMVGALIPTFMDWQANPAGLFRGAGGTHWDIVLETLWSWLWPLALAAIPAFVLFMFLRHRMIDRKTQEE